MSDHGTAAAASAQEVELEVRRLLDEAKRTRGGGWSLENLLDAQFLAQAASLLQQSFHRFATVRDARFSGPGTEVATAPAVEPTPYV